LIKASALRPSVGACCADLVIDVIDKIFRMSRIYVVNPVNPVHHLSN